MWLQFITLSVSMNMNPISTNKSLYIEYNTVYWYENQETTIKYVQNYNKDL